MILANLDVERHWARALAPDRSGTSLPLAVRRRISAAATLLRVLTLPGERIWVPEPVDPRRIALLPGETEAPLLVSGDPPEPGDVRLAWGALGKDVARLNHRAFCLTVRDELDCAIAGARMVREVSAENGSWVLKAPLSAAGRDRVRFDGAPTPKQERSARRLLDRFGELLLEPWLDRTADYGCCGWAGGEETELLPAHRLEVDSVGRFRAIATCDDAPAGFVDYARRVGDRLRAEGYRGPFGIDGCLYRAADGGIRLQPLLEINARMTFGHIAHALFGCEGGGRLVLGSGPPPPGVVPLLLPGEDDPTSAWIESG